MDMYFITAAILFITQMANLRSLYSLEIEIFKQKLRYFAYKGYLKSLSIYRYVTSFFATPKEIPKKKVIEVEKYEDKYKQKFDELKEDTATSKTNILFETTPNGNVIMFYDNEKKSYDYYSDKVIPFRFLETVSRKYVVFFKCKSITKEINRYTYLGKMANFSFLQKPDKKVLNKKLNMSFKEYKNMKL